MLTTHGIAYPHLVPACQRLLPPPAHVVPLHDSRAEPPPGAADHLIACSSAQGERLITAREIIAIFSSENYTTVVTERQRWFLRRSMAEWDAMLPAGLFLRVHRTAIVNLAAVEVLERRSGETTLARLRGFPQPVRVSRSRQLALRIALAERR